ncbi:MAG: hypothetical protein KGL39_54300 [Patescibacteria group bacterium]|nr:hypothetical protein [Patescibacteria group bacterium]
MGEADRRRERAGPLRREGAGAMNNTVTSSRDFCPNCGYETTGLPICTKCRTPKPSADIRLNVVNPAASTQFEVGKEYYVDFTPAE